MSYDVDNFGIVAHGRKSYELYPTSGENQTQFHFEKISKMFTCNFLPSLSR